MRFPASLSTCISGALSKSLVTIGAAVIPRSRRMNGVLVPLPAPGAPPSQMMPLGSLAAPDSTRDSIRAHAVSNMPVACATALSESPAD